MSSKYPRSANKQIRTVLDISIGPRCSVSTGQADANVCSIEFSRSHGGKAVVLAHGMRHTAQHEFEGRKPDTDSQEARIADAIESEDEGRQRRRLR